MKYVMILLAGLFLVIAAALAIEFKKLQELKNRKSARTLESVPEEMIESTSEDHVTVIMEDGQDRISEIQSEIFGDSEAIKHAVYREAVPEELKNLVESTSRKADEAKKNNELQYPNAVEHTGNLDLRKLRDEEEESVEAEVDRMMNDIMTSVAAYEMKSFATEPAEVPAAAVPEEHNDGVDYDLLKQIEEINRSAEDASNGIEQADEEPVAEEDIEKMLELNVPAPIEIPAELLPEKTGNEMEDLANMLESINNHADEYAKTVQEEPVRTAVKPTDSKRLPLVRVRASHCMFAKWNGAFGKGEYVLYFFRSMENYNVFADAVRRMYEKDLVPAYRFFAAVCEDRNEEAAAFAEVCGWFTQRNLKVSRVLCDTAEVNGVSEDTVKLGIAAGEMISVVFDEMNELGKLELTQCAQDAAAAGIRCVLNERTMLIMSGNKEEAESVLREVEEIAEHYDFTISSESVHNADDLELGSSEFRTSVTNAAGRTFKDHEIRYEILPASEWNAGSSGCELIWFVPAARRAVSFYLNMLCIG